MKNTVITEFVKFKTLETTSEEQLLSTADLLNDFLRNQDGFINGRLLKNIGENDWCFIYHFESMEQVKAIGEKMRNQKVFDAFMPVTVPGSVSVTFHNELKSW